VGRMGCWGQVPAACVGIQSTICSVTCLCVGSRSMFAGAIAETTSITPHVRSWMFVCPRQRCIALDRWVDAVFFLKIGATAGRSVPIVLFHIDPKRQALAHSLAPQDRDGWAPYTSPRLAWTLVVFVRSSHVICCDVPGQAAPGQEPNLETVSAILNVLEAERRAWLWAKRTSFHPNFGSEFTSGTRPTLFASLVMVRGVHKSG
jgi:hypothetical protein